ncbi:MAG: 3-hydroxyacyl-CoA dehydrogenase family protein [Candidatus Binatia bacterium]
MAENSVTIIGENQLALELAALCKEKGLEVALQAQADDLSPTCPLAIETLAQDGERKKNLLARLDASLPPASVIVTSCLGSAVSYLAAPLKKPDRLVGFATFYPLKERKLIELATGLRGAKSAAQKAEEFFKLLGKETLRVKDTAGLTFPRILSLIVNEAARALEEGVASAEEIDIAMRLGVNYPKGPLKWADEIGLDEVLAVIEGLQRETGEDRYRPATLLKKLVAAGFVGEIAGRGFYWYNESQVKS